MVPMYWRKLQLGHDLLFQHALDVIATWLDMGCYVKTFHVEFSLSHQLICYFLLNSKNICFNKGSTHLADDELNCENIQFYPSSIRLNNWFLFTAVYQASNSGVNSNMMLWYATRIDVMWPGYKIREKVHQ